jgi:hypothetical protein
MFDGEKQKIIEQYENNVARKLTDDEMATITEFVNGYKFQQ